MDEHRNDEFPILGGNEKYDQDVKGPARDVIETASLVPEEYNDLIKVLNEGSAHDLRTTISILSISIIAIVLSVIILLLCKRRKMKKLQESDPESEPFDSISSVTEH